jgi:rhomboid protease GluP
MTGTAPQTPPPAPRPRRPSTPVVRAVIGVQIALYVAALLLDPGHVPLDPRRPLSFLAPNGWALLRLGMTSGRLWELGFWWTVLTAVHLHGGLLHLAFNALWTREIGTVVERWWGPGRFFLVYSAGGVGGFVVSNIALGAPTIGASGSIFGLLGALIVLGRRRRAAQFTRQMWQTAAVLFAFGFLIPAVNNWGHAGGFVSGMGAAALLPLADVRPERRVVRALAIAVALVTLIGFPLSFLATMGLR